MGKIAPQPGFQTNFLANSADICIAGGSAGPGKTFGLLLEFCRHINVNDWGGVIFRRTSPQITSEGGLWDTSEKIYPHVGAAQVKSQLTWKFPRGAKLKFSHLEYEKDVFNWQGAQIPFLGFDELTHFSKKMFFYLLTRNRSMSGIKPYVRGTCNPDPDSWVADFISWWIDQDTGLPIKDRAGVIRYLLMDRENYIWGSTVEEVLEAGRHVIEEIPDDLGINPKDLVKSVSFVPGSIYDNKMLIKEDPGYLANLLAQDDDTKAQLLHGNWKVRVSEEEIIDFFALKDSFTNDFVATGNKYLSADIALEGSDKFIIGVFDDWQLIDIKIMPRSDGKEVIEAIKNFKRAYQVPERNIVFDSDGLGGFVSGFLPGAFSFKNGGRPIPREGDPENYEHLKAQCYYALGRRINNNGLHIHERVASKAYDRDQTVMQRIMSERRAIKKYKPDHDGKLRLLPKHKQKIILSGSSPDIMDMLMMREVFELDFRKSISMSGFSHEI